MSEGFFQLKSMTAFGRGVSDFPQGRVTVEIQSVNRRFLEVNVSLPRGFNRFEMDVRKSVSEKIGRGMVNVGVTWKMDPKQTVTLQPNVALALSLKGAWEKLADALKLEHEMPLELLVHQKDLFVNEEEITDEAAYRKAVNKALEDALHALLVMKRQEGKVLAHDLHERLKSLKKELTQIEARSGEATEKYRQKLTARLEELFKGSPENEEKVLREVAVYAEKVDITEEITRFKSHVEQFAQTLDKPLEQTGESLGKILDFLLQELMREINTIGSKASDLTVAQKVVTIKSELERIREQVQNIE